METIRLCKLMAQRGLCSRREADRLIEAGYVRVDGHVICELGARVSPDVRIELNAEGLKQQEKAVTILLHKPLGYVSAQAEEGYRPAKVLLTPDRCADRRSFDASRLPKLAVAGRLDINSSGLLIFTQDGRIARQLIGENSPIEKEYIVGVQGWITEEKLTLLREGLELDGRKLRQARVERIAPGRLRFVLREGRKRQIRRMCQLVDLEVTSLQRIRVGQVRLGKLAPGQWRLLGSEEVF